MSDFSIQRRNMVDGQIRPGNVTDWRIIDAMRVVPREAFVTEAQRELAYLDLDIDVGGTGAQKRFLLKPMVSARLLQHAEIQEKDNVLIVGCASGYLAALAAKLTIRVTATESDSALAARANDILRKTGFGEVTVIKAEAADGAPKDGPYDVIILNGATEIVPDRLYAQLKVGGRLVGIFAMTNPPRATIVTRSIGDFGSRPLFDVTAPMLPGLERTPAFVF
jgi:protein-L-isoaspartate(D-aspartate) O-methyltransferase